MKNKYVLIECFPCEESFTRLELDDAEAEVLKLKISIFNSHKYSSHWWFELHTIEEWFNKIEDTTLPQELQ